jgi:hypothetical protein
MIRTTSKLALIADRSADEPRPAPAGLDAFGTALWREVTASYMFDDPGSYAMLREACASLQRAERLRRLIDEAGEVIKLKGGTFRANPLLRDEAAARALGCRLLGKLGLDLEPVQSAPVPHPRGR